jgi:flagellin
MGLRINTNIQALAAQRFLGINSEHQKASLDHLSSGSRINKAGDDAAGLAISEKLKAEIRSMRQATRNANDGVSLIQVAEGGLNEISGILIRMRELSIQAASDTIGDPERGFVDKEVQQLKDELNRISNITEYDGTKLLDGSAPALEFQVGTHNNPLLDRFVFDSQNLITSTQALGLDGVGTQTKLNAQENLTSLDDAIEHVNGNRATLGALQNRMQSTISNLNIYRENLEAANSRIRDTDMAEESSELVKNNILTQTTVSVLGQANQSPQLALKLIG